MTGEGFDQSQSPTSSDEPRWFHPERTSGRRIYVAEHEVAERAYLPLIPDSAEAPTEVWPTAPITDLDRARDDLSTRHTTQQPSSEPVWAPSYATPTYLPSPSPRPVPSHYPPHQYQQPDHGAGRDAHQPGRHAAEITAPPRPEDLLLPDQTDPVDEPAERGLRGLIHRASGGLIKPAPSPAEQAERQARLEIVQGLAHPMTIVVVQPKGGAGKTPTAIGLSAALGVHRGGYVLGWDNNETRGTLGVRVANHNRSRATVWDLLRHLDDFERFDALVGNLGQYVRPQPESRFDALASDDNPANMEQIGDVEFERLHDVLRRFYRLIVVDTGNNVRAANWQAAVNAADLVVVTSTYRRDVGFSASWVLDHLTQTGREGLAREAVTILTAADPHVDKKVRAELLGHFQRRTRAVVEVPYDPHVAMGGPILWSRLRPQTRQAWLEAGATTVRALGRRDA